jgi:hypothetical protein
MSYTRTDQLINLMIAQLERHREQVDAARDVITMNIRVTFNKQNGQPSNVFARFEYATDVSGRPSREKHPVEYS